MNQSNPQLFNQIQLPNRVAVLGKGMVKNNRLLSVILNTQVMRHYPFNPLALTQLLSPFGFGCHDVAKVEAYIGWGNKKSYQRAKYQADRYDLPVYSIEDGFLRSIDSGINSRQALSVVIDDLGIYFDLTQPSRLESMICQRLQAQYWQKEHHSLASRLIKQIVDNQLSKYNQALNCPNLIDMAIYQLGCEPTQDYANHVLLIDQVVGDQSITGACVNEHIGKQQFANMLTTALEQHPNAIIWIKAHPANDQGYLTNMTLPKKSVKRIYILRKSVNPIALLKQVSHVYTVSSHMGFEALMLKTLGYDISVHCFGVSWYTGWGVTDDTGLTSLNNEHPICQLLQQVQLRRQQLMNNNPTSSFSSSDNIDVATRIYQLFFASYLDYSHYVDPASKQPCDIEQAIRWLVTNRHWHHILMGDLVVYEFSRWKLPFIRKFVGFTQTKLFIKPKPRLKNILHPNHFRVDLQKPLLVWGLNKRQQLVNKKQLHLPIKKHSKTQSHLYCMEDGFIRSNGLGATLQAPLSVVIDTQGIYYNATQASDLESLLKNCPSLTAEQRQRVHRLQQILLQQQVSKYNVGKKIQQQPWLDTLTQQLQASKNNRDNDGDNHNKGIKVVLIVGQVEDDLSVKNCGSLIQTNAELIQQVVATVKKYDEDVYVIYKPHPDVEAGLRSGKVNEACKQQVNAVAKDLAMPDCLDLVDEVHTISSLTGFEALLRGKSVTCYGLPFYAGWGLTHDINSQSDSQALYQKRRHRDTPLTLAQLIYCTLIEYPLYRLPDGYGLAQVEQVIEHLYLNSIDNHSHTVQSVQQSSSRLFMQIRHQVLSRFNKA